MPHGHEFQVMAIDDPQFPGAVRDTVMVPPGYRVLVAFDANNPGGVGRCTVICYITSRPGCSRACSMFEAPPPDSASSIKMQAVRADGVNLRFSVDDVGGL
jgi:hypothetical protein